MEPHRPTKAASEKRLRRVKVNLNDDEHARLTAFAAANGEEVGPMLRRLALREVGRKP